MNTSQPLGQGVSRRAMLMGTGGIVGAAGGYAAGVLSNPLSAALGATPGNAGAGTADQAAQERHSDMQSYRPVYHYSVPDNWKNDPQRPVFLDGEYLYYYLYNKDYLEGGHGTEWRLITTTDHVSFAEEGVALPKFTNDNGDAWSGSLVVDHDDTAGYGEGAVIALVTQRPDDGDQAQYLWYSTDKGRTFQPGPEDPVLPNPGTEAFRDPKIIWDQERERWFMANAEGSRVGFYASADLKDWREVGEFTRDDIGLLECPDIFEMTADNGDHKWVLGVSANGKSSGLPATYAYWVGTFDGSEFTAEYDEPQWLDWGFDFYGAVTYPHHDDDAAVDLSIRYAWGWANFWDYPHNAPTMITDGYNGDDMIVRQLRLIRGDTYYLASQPAAALTDYASTVHELGDIEVSGEEDLEIQSRAYTLECEVVWDPANPPENVGLQVCRAPGGGRHVAVGAFFEETYVYVNRAPTFGPGEGGESQTPFDPDSGSMRLHLLVDHVSVECFFQDGKDVHSHRVFPLATDDRIQLYAFGADVTFKNLVIRDMS